MSTASIRSMTGYGESDRDLEHGRLRVEIRTVNGRYLNVQFRGPPGLERHHRGLERSLREHFVRGQVTVSVSLERVESPADARAIGVDLERARAYVKGLRSLKEELGLEGSIDVGVLSRYRGIFEEPELDAARRELPEDHLFEAIYEAARSTVAAREEEGAFLREDLSARLDAMEAELAGVEARAPGRLTAERDRLRAAV